MDRYTKFILTIIASGILTLNVQLFKDDVITHANAAVAGMTYLELSQDYDFKRAVRRVVQKYCDTSGSGLVNC